MNSTVIKPTIGRIVWYYPTPVEQEKGLGISQHELAAIVCHVHSDYSVNLLVVGTDGRQVPKGDVELLQPGDDAPELEAGGFCRWMPFQIGQATALREQKQVGPAAGGSVS